MKTKPFPAMTTSTWHIARTFCAILAFSIIPISHATDPMTSPQSLEIREAFTDCREKPTEMSRFLCNCDVVDRQCATALKPQHGQWRTIEVWHGETDADREVYFYLPPSSEDLFTLEQFDQGIIVSCLLDTSAVTIHLGDSVNMVRPVEVMLDGEPLAVQLVEDGINVMAIARNTDVATQALSHADELIVQFADEWGDTVEITYPTAGFSQAMLGWQPLCKSAIS